MKVKGLAGSDEVGGGRYLGGNDDFTLSGISGPLAASAPAGPGNALTKWKGVGTCQFT